MARTQQPLVVATDLTKVYVLGDTELRALDGVSLTVGPGEFVAIMGASGSGKSTLMNVLGCLDRPTSGELHARRPGGLAPQPRGARRGAQPHHRLRLPELQPARPHERRSRTWSCRSSTRGLPRRERRERSRVALERVGLGGRLDHRPSQLSGGQQQRVAIARAIVNEPKLIFADEPTGNLDTKTSIDVMALFQELWRAGLTIVYVTHEPDVARYASRIVMVRDGKIVSDTQQEPLADGGEKAA